MTIIENTVIQNLTIFYMRKSQVISIVALLFTAFCAGPAFASLTTVTWDLNPAGLNTPVGSSSHTFVSQGYSIAAYGFDVGNGSNPAHSLFYRNGGGDEIGLGLVDTLHNELQVTHSGSPANFIQLDLRSILSAGFINGKISVGSVQTNESFVLYGSNALGTLGTKLGNTVGSNFDVTFLNVPSFGTYQFLSVAAASADVLPVAFQAQINAVPEMESLFPIIGLMVAVVSTQTLRRRRWAEKVAAGAYNPTRVVVPARKQSCVTTKNSPAIS